MSKHRVSTHSSSRRGSIVGAQAFAALQHVQDVDLPSHHQRHPTNSLKRLPCPSQQRKSQSLNETPFDTETFANDENSKTSERPDTVLYLAYGSNLCAETFQGKRGIKPLAQVNVLVPELVMTFDLAGLPYVEPCFANTRFRKIPASAQPDLLDNETGPLLDTGGSPRYHKDRWKKGLVGVVYEVSREDYAHIIATEGGGASYQDIVVDCYVLPTAQTVPEKPDTEPFKAHTLFSPAIPPNPPGKPPGKSRGRISRPDPSYAQASARYLKLITDGADEHDLPAEYKEYLQDLQPYTITTNRQRLGQYIFLALWMPLVTLLFSMGKLFAGKDGRAPTWMAEFMGAVFRAVWASYDSFFFKLFGDGERTISKDEDEEARQHRKCYGAILEKGVYGTCLK
ncbi:hypothetical protein MMC16_003355 [Acarospora aff. strigata]|nr:hypothetical protein [Acarospora aff. strigata]